MEIVMIVLTGAGLLAYGAWHVLFSPRAKTRQALREAPRVLVNAAREGQVVKIVGKVRYLAGREMLTAPISGRTCAHYTLEIEESRSDGNRSYWATIVEEHKTVPFLLEDPTGKAHLDGAMSRVVVTMDEKRRSGPLNDASPQLEELLARYGHESRGMIFNKRVRYKEGVFEEGEFVAAVGRCQWEVDLHGEGAQAGGFREAAKRLTIRAPEPDELLITDERALIGKN